MKTVLAWHFLPADKHLRWGTKQKVRVGKKLTIAGEPLLCKHGFHGSVRAIDALQYAPGPIVCRVRLGGTIVQGDDKLVGTARTVLKMADAERVLHEFACWCATRALKTAKVTDARSWAAIDTKLKWLRGEASEQELAEAAREAARAAEGAAWAAAWAAAGAAWAASWAAARAAARAAAGAAGAAARAAARAAWAASLAAGAAGAAARAAAGAQNRKLESMLRACLAHPNEYRMRRKKERKHE